MRAPVGYAARIDQEQDERGRVVCTLTFEPAVSRGNVEAAGDRQSPAEQPSPLARRWDAYGIRLLDGDLAVVDRIERTVTYRGRVVEFRRKHELWELIDGAFTEQDPEGDLAKVARYIRRVNEAVGFTLLKPLKDDNELHADDEVRFAGWVERAESADNAVRENAG